ncbi:MAG TPA: ribosomal protein S18-alanine N-acetyltransferase [Polyangiaceae bacterium]|nr:ribosomal protein S18-alanine N-acetyltransferase [Polyangiaceae bacterium]
MDAFVVEPMAPADVERVRELARLSGSGFDPAAELARTWAKLWVARAAAGAAPLGFALVWLAADEVHLLDLAVDPAFRRRGAGRALLRAVIDGGRAAGGTRVLLEVRRSNEAALGLYAGAGFCELDVRRAYYADNGEDALVMRLDLAVGERS